MYRSIDTAMWSDPKIKEMIPDAKLLFLYLITNNHTHVSGIYYVPRVLISYETGIKDRALDTLLGTLSMGNLAKWDGVSEVVWVVNMLRHQSYEGRKSYKIVTAVQKQLVTLHNSLLIKDFLSHYSDWNIPYTYPIGYPFDTRAPVYKDQDQYQEQEQKRTTTSSEVSSDDPLSPAAPTDDMWGTPQAMAAM